MIPYLDNQLANGIRISHMTRHLLGLYLGRPAARIWRRYLGEHARQDCHGGKILSAALAAMQNALDDAA